MPRRSRKVALGAVVAALLLLPHPAVGDEQDELERTRRRLGEVEAVLGDARADAGAVAGARAAAALRRRSAELRRLIRQEELARQRAAAAARAGAAERAKAFWQANGWH